MLTRTLTLIAVLVAAFALFYAAAKTPDPKPVNAPQTEFSAGRAMIDVAATAPVPHPIGSPANARVRDYLVQRMTALGLSPRVMRAESHGVRRFGNADYISGADVENVIGVLPGRDPAAPALALMAHYDSVPGSPGAADDITGVADVLEIVRAIKAQGTPARDVVVAITDGEEAGLLGARAFFAADPMAKHVGIVMNLESRGGGGRAAMFETGAGNGAVIDLFGRTAVSPNANALTAYVYKLLPNDTDFSVARAHGLTGLNYAFIGRQFDYHSPSSTVAALDRGSVQQMGDQALGPARVLAFGYALPENAPDAVYSDVFGLGVVAYPAWGGWIVLAAVVGLMILGRRRARLGVEDSWLDVLQGVGAGLLLLAGAALLLLLTRHVTGVAGGWLGYRPLLARFAPFEVAMALTGVAGLLITGAAVQRGEMRLVIGVGALVAAGAAWALGDFDTAALIFGAVTTVLAVLVVGRPGRSAGTWLGLALTGLVGAIAVQIIAPTAAFVLAWPVLAASVCAALTGWGTRRGVVIDLSAAIIAILSLAWLGGLFHALLQGLDVPEGPALVAWLAAMLVWPLTQLGERERNWGWAPAVLSLAGGLGVALWLNLTPPWTPRHPEAAEPLYVVEEDGKAWRVAPRPLAPWTIGVLIADGGAYEEHAFPGVSVPGVPPSQFGGAPARAVATPTRDVAVTRSADGAVAIRAVPPPGATALNLDLRVSSPVTNVTVAGKAAAILTHAGEWSHVRWQAAPEGVTITFKPTGPGAVGLDYGMVLDHWPVDAKPLPAMPPDVMAWDRSGSTVLVGARTLTWLSPSKIEQAPPPRRWSPGRQDHSRPGLGARPQVHRRHPPAGHAFGRHGRGPVRIDRSHKHAHAGWRPRSRTGRAHAPRRWTPSRDHGCSPGCSRTDSRG